MPEESATKRVRMNRSSIEITSSFTTATARKVSWARAAGRPACDAGSSNPSTNPAATA
jgi:hypothetical protein